MTTESVKERRSDKAWSGDSARGHAGRWGAAGLATQHRAEGKPGHTKGRRQDGARGGARWRCRWQSRQRRRRLQTGPDGNRRRRLKMCRVSHQRRPRRGSHTGPPAGRPTTPARAGRTPGGRRCAQPEGGGAGGGGTKFDQGRHLHLASDPLKEADERRTSPKNRNTQTRTAPLEDTPAHGAAAPRTRMGRRGAAERRAAGRQGGRAAGGGRRRAGRRKRM